MPLVVGACRLARALLLCIGGLVISFSPSPCLSFGMWCLESRGHRVPVSLPKPAMAPLPSRAASRPRSVLAFLTCVDVFALSSSTDWYRLRAEWWSKTLEPKLSGEPWVRAVVATGRRWGGWPRSLSLSSRNDVRRPFSDLIVGLEDTPSRGKIVKEPLHFSLLEPAVLGVILEVCFSVLKTYFFSVN
jgi:hypothetical protein